MTHSLRTLAAAIVAMAMASPAPAAEIQMHGFVQAAASLRLDPKPLAAGPDQGLKRNWLVSEERLRLEATGDSDDGVAGFVAKIDGLFDNVAAGNATSLDVRELWGEWRGDAIEIRAGRQMATWGVADRLFIADIWPKDWAAFYAGLPLEYMKKPVDALRFSAFAGSLDGELWLVPRGQVDVVPKVDRWNVYTPPGIKGERKPQAGLKDAEIALRLHAPLGGWDINLYAARTHWHQPDKGFDPAAGVIIYPRLNVLALTLQGQILGGVLSVEAGRYQSVDDKAGTNPAIANSQDRWLAGYEHELMPDVTLAVQFYGERMRNYASYWSAAQNAFAAGLGPEPVRQHRVYATANLRALMLNQTLTATLFAMGVQHGGRMVNPELAYAVNDALTVAAGGHIFWGGPDTWTLGMMKNNDNAYLWARWSF